MIFTVGLWSVKPGREDEFIARWREMADWTRREVIGPTPSGEERGTLLRDLKQPGRFVSVGPWESVDAVEAWRSNPGFVERVGKMRDLLEEFTPMTLNDVT